MSNYHRIWSLIFFNIKENILHGRFRHLRNIFTYILFELLLLSIYFIQIKVETPSSLPFQFCISQQQQTIQSTLSRSIYGDRMKDLPSKQINYNTRHQFYATEEFQNQQWLRIPFTHKERETEVCCIVIKALWSVFSGVCRSCLADYFILYEKQQIKVIIILQTLSLACLS